jgi:DNA polymerase III epsilon subunit-like protein
MIKLTKLINEMEVQGLPSQKLLKWFLDRIDHTFIFFDTETTGLDRKPEGKPENQLTQISAIATQLNGETLRFFELGRFNVGIKLNDSTLQQMSNEPDAPDEESDEYGKWLFGTKKGILKFNHYDLANSESYEEERNALEKFDNFLKEYDNVTLIAHNAPFDLKWIQFHEIFKDSTDEMIDSIDFFKNFFFPILNTISKDKPEYQAKLDKFSSNSRGDKSNALKSIATGFDDDVNQLKKKLQGAHNAVVDCEITMEVFEKGLLMVYRYLND